MPTSVRLDAETEALLARLAKNRRQTKSAILREALLRLAQDEADSVNGPYTLVAEFVGIAEGGPDDLARHHKQVFRKIVSNKAQR